MWIDQAILLQNELQKEQQPDDAGKWSKTSDSELEHKPIHPVQNEAHYENEASSKAGETLKILTSTAEKFSASQPSHI